MSLFVGRHATEEVYFIEIEGTRVLLTQPALLKLLDTLSALLPFEDGDELPGEKPVAH